MTLCTIAHVRAVPNAFRCMQAADTETLLESDDGSTDHHSSAEPSQTAEAVIADTLLSGPAADCDSAIQVCAVWHA